MSVFGVAIEIEIGRRPPWFLLSSPRFYANWFFILWTSMTFNPKCDELNFNFCLPSLGEIQTIPHWSNSLHETFVLWLLFSREIVNVSSKQVHYCIFHSLSRFKSAIDRWIEIKSIESCDNCIWQKAPNDRLCVSLLSSQ